LAVSGSNPSSNGNGRAPAPSQPAAPRVPEKPEAIARGAESAPKQAVMQRPRWTAATNGNQAKSGAEKPGNGTAAAAAAPASRPRPPAVPAAAVRPAAVAPNPAAMRAAPSQPREAGKAVPGAGEPYPPLSERPVNGIGNAPMASTRRDPARTAPRSPRTALEPDTVELPARRSKSARHPVVVIGNAIISLFVLAAIAVVVLLFIGKERFEAPGPLAADRIVNIPHGSGIRDIADDLQQAGVIDQPWVFIGGVMVLKARQGLRAGEYQFKAHASVRDVVETIVEGRVVSHQISIPEGLTSEQIVARLMDNDVLTGNITEIPGEGSLLPDTYNFTRGVTREQMIQRMQEAQQRLVQEIWDHRAPDLPLKTPEQLVILASLVEKETGKPEERTRVAAVFVNRLKQKMRLQSDPTIIYGLVGGKGTLGRPIMKSEIDQPTPYNTYQIDGLPPGPICNPGRASLEAAANPARTRELYFVADGTGGHVFAETYEQHEKNVARLRLIETNQKDQAPIDATTQAPAQEAPVVPAAPSASSHHASSRHKKPRSE
jgi:UPF0755 protein